jgi:hypothetical protein
MNTYDKIRSFCRKFRIIVGVVILTIGFLLGDGSLNLGWWWLGLLPLIAGIVDFCPTCIISKKCTPKNLEQENK